MNMLDYFVFHMYSPKKRCHSDMSINEMRLEKFKLSGYNDLPVIPPSKHALLQHAKHACYQAGPTLWGWKQDENNKI